MNDPEEGTRNENINFITASKTWPDHEEALFRLRQLAAIYKPVMKSHGLQINHLQEYEHNREFAGRNFNAGENIEMVMRGPNGRFLPFELVCSVFAHELAHNFHMNHGAGHSKLTRDLNAARRELQARGYYGDGFWSRGQRLGDQDWVGGSNSLSTAELPGNLCGGAWSRRRRPGAKRPRKHLTEDQLEKRRKSRAAKGQPSLRSGAQTAANVERTAGKRRALNLPGSGSRLDGQDHLPLASAKSDSYKLDPNSTFRKRATTNSARDARAAAAMRRAEALKRDPHDSKDEKPSDMRQELSISGETKPQQDWSVSRREDGDTQVGLASSQTESEGESHGEDSETEEELVYDSDGTEHPTPTCGTADNGGAVHPAPPSPSTKSDFVSSRPIESQQQRMRRMEQFRRASGGRSALQARQEWQDLIRDTRQQMNTPRGSTAAPLTAKAVKEESCDIPRATATRADAEDDDDDDDDDDEIVFVGVRTSK